MSGGCLRRAKAEAPLATDAEIEDMVAAFEACRWPYRHWTHRAHLGVAVCYLTKLPFAEALDRTRHHIRQYNRTCGDPDGYHETLTVLFLRRAERYLRERAEMPSMAVAVAELAELCDRTFPLRHYSPERLWSAEARGGWVEPDREPLAGPSPPVGQTGAGAN